MAKAEGQKRPALKVGDVVDVERVDLDGEVLSTDQLVVEEEGQPRVVAQVGRVQLTETEFKLRPQGQ